MVLLFRPSPTAPPFRGEVLRGRRVEPTVRSGPPRSATKMTGSAESTEPWAVPDRAVAPLLVLVLLWTAGEGLAIPLWTAFIAGLVPASQRGRWLAMRGASASAASAGIMIALLILMQFQSKSGAVPFAYTLAAISGLVSLWQLRFLFSANPQPIAKEPESQDLRAPPPLRLATCTK